MPINLLTFHQRHFESSFLQKLIDSKIIIEIAKLAANEAGHFWYIFYDGARFLN